MKDKARNLAAMFVRAGQGIPGGFEGVIRPDTQFGRRLAERYGKWW